MSSSFLVDDLPAVASLVSSVAALEIMPRFARLETLRVSQKTSAFDVVTEADEQSEHAIVAQLRQRFHGALVVGEEASQSDPGLLAQLENAPLAFVVDPLDGTLNFASGVPLFGVMVAVVESGEVVAGLIHDPVCKRTISAFRGAGAWSNAANGTRYRLRVAAAASLSEMQGIVGTNFLPEPRGRRSTATCRGSA